MAVGETISVVIWREDSDYVKIEILTVGDTYGCRESQVTVRVGSWSGRFAWFIFGSELTRLADGLEALYRDLSGLFQLRPLEPNLTLIFDGDGRGHISVDGVAEAHLGSGTRLIFQLELDQSDLPPIIRSLRGASLLSA